MPRLALIIGGLLTALAVIGYLVGLMGNYASWTALIPAFAGVPILLCGLIAQASEPARKHAMHAAVAVALLGVIAAGMGFFARVVRAETRPSTMAIISLMGMLILCAWLLVAGINSFIQARRVRQSGFEVLPGG
jgi:hypothetical protein